MSSSAYFPNEEFTREFSNIVVPPAQSVTINQSRVIEKKTALIEFPAERRILWDRTPEAKVKFLFAKDVLPQLYIPPEASKDIIRHMAKGDKRVIDRQMTVTETACCNESERAFIEARSFKGVSNPYYVFKMQEKSSPTSSSSSSSSSASASASASASDEFTLRDDVVANEHLLTVPINVRSSNDADLLFAEESTSQMIQNLGKSIRSCREFALKSCVRIRAAGYACQTNDQYTATMRYEVILPNVSLQLTQVRMIPFLDTPLTVQLFRPSLYQAEAAANSYHLNINETRAMRERLTFSNSTQSAQLSSYSKTKKFGYLTMNRTRKLVPLLESDTSLPTCPLVGVWVSGLSEHGSEPMAHPFVWAACLRFLNYENIHERVFIADNQTFLLVVMNGNSYSNYEVRITTDTSGVQQDYLCADFSVDLVTDTINYLDDGGSEVYQDAILGTFRPLRRQDQLSTFRASMERSKENYADIAQIAQSQSKQLSQRYIPTSVSNSMMEQGSFSGSIAQTVSTYEEFPSCQSRSVSATTVTYDPSRYVSQLGPGPEETFTLERNTPLPRRSIPTPYEAPTSPSASIDKSIGVEGQQQEAREEKNERQEEVQGDTEEVSTDISKEMYESSSQHMYAETHRNTSFSASDIIMAQQLQLDYLRKQVDQLRGVIFDMGGQVPSLGVAPNPLTSSHNVNVDNKGTDNIDAMKTGKLQYEADFGVVGVDNSKDTGSDPIQGSQPPTSALHTGIVVGVGKGRSPNEGGNKGTSSIPSDNTETPERERDGGDDSDSPELVIMSFYSANESIDSFEESVADSDDEEILVVQPRSEHYAQRHGSGALDESQFFMELPSIPQLPVLDMPLKGLKQDIRNPLESFTPLMPTALDAPLQHVVNEEDRDVRIVSIRDQEQEEQEEILKVRIGNALESEGVTLEDLETESIASIEARYMNIK